MAIVSSPSDGSASGFLYLICSEVRKPGPHRVCVNILLEFNRVAVWITHKLFFFNILLGSWLCRLPYCSTSFSRDQKNLIIRKIKWFSWTTCLNCVQQILTPLTTQCNGILIVFYFVFWYLFCFTFYLNNHIVSFCDWV